MTYISRPTYPSIKFSVSIHGTTFINICLENKDPLLSSSLCLNRGKRSSEVLPFSLSFLSLVLCRYLPQLLIGIAPNPHSVILRGVLSDQPGDFSHSS